MEEQEYPEPSPTAVQWIRDNPDRLTDFNHKYGAGAGEKYLPAIVQPETSTAEPQQEEQSWGDIAADVGEGIVEGLASIGTETARFFSDTATIGETDIPFDPEKLGLEGFDPDKAKQIEAQRVQQNDEAAARKQRLDAGLDQLTIFGKERDTTIGAVTQGGVQFLGAMFGVGKLTKIKAFTTWKGATAAGFAADAVAFDPEMANAIRILHEEFGADSELVQKALEDGEGGPWDTKLKNKLIRMGSAVGQNETVTTIFSNDELTNMENRVKNGILGTALAVPFDVGILVYRGLRIRSKATKELAETGKVSEETAAEAAEVEEAVTTWKELVEREATNPVIGSTYNPELKTITTKDGMVFSMETGARIADNGTNVPAAPKAPESGEAGTAPKVVDATAQPPEIGSVAPSAPKVTSEQVDAARAWDARTAGQTDATPTNIEGLEVVQSAGKGTDEAPPKMDVPEKGPEISSSAPAQPVGSAQKPLVNTKVFKSKAVANTVKEIQQNPPQLQSIAETLNDRFTFNPKYFEGPRSSEAILTATAQELKKAGLFKKIGTAETESLNTVAEEGIDILARELTVNPKVFRRRLQQVSQNAADQYRWAVAGKVEMVRLQRQIVDLADEIDAAVAKGADATDLRKKWLETIDAHADVQLSVSGLKTASGRGLNANKIRVDGELTDQALDRLEQIGGAVSGGKKVDAMIRQMRLAKTQAAKNALFRNQSTLSAKIWGILGETFINSILAGPHTHALNMGASSINAVARPLLRTYGGVVKGDWETAAKGLRQEYYLFTSLAESLQLIHFNGGLLPKLNTQNSALASAISSAVKDKTLLDTTTKIGIEGDTVRQLSSRNLGINPVIGAPVDLLGLISTSTSRMLGAEDQFFKHLVYRSTVKAAAATDAAKMTLDDLAELGFTEGTLKRRKAEYMKEAVGGALNTKQVLDEKWAQLVREGRVLDTKKAKAEFMGQNLDSYNSSSIYAKEGLEEARAATLTTPLGKDSSMYGLKMWAIQQPALRQIVPFIQTPTNVLRENFQRVPVISRFGTGLRKELDSTDPEVAALARGKVAYGVGMALYAYYLASQGRLTGSGPSYVTNPKLAETWNKSPNWQANSIVIWDDEGNPVFRDLSKMLPHFGAFTLAGQLYEYIERYEGHGKDTAFWFAAISQMFASQVTMQSSLSGVGDFIQAMSGDASPQEFDRFLKQKAASMVPLGALSYTLNKEQDGIMRDLTDWSETIKSRIYDPALEAAGGERNAPAKYFWLTGETQDIPEYAWGFLREKTFDLADGSKGRVFSELRKLPKGLSGPTRRLGTAELGPSAYQELNRLYGTVKIDGLTLIQALAREIDSPEYDRKGERQPYGISDFRRDLLQSVVTEYRQEALDVMSELYPEMQELIDRQIEVEDELMEGGMPADREVLNERFDITF